MCCGSADGTSAPQHGKINKKCISNWPNHNFGFKGKSVVRFLGRFSIQPLRENPQLGPSSSVILLISLSLF